MVQSFGSAQVNATTPAKILSFTLTGLSSTPTASLGGVDFSASALSCNNTYTACTAAVTFAPLSVGLKQDALVLKNSSGTPIASAFLNGIGTAPALRALPASVATYAGTGTGGLINGRAAAAAFRNPQGLAIDLQGNLYVADSVNQVIRKVTTAGVVSTLAGNGGSGYSGDGGSALLAMLNTPTGLALDAAGNLFIADEGNGLIRRVDAFTGIITTVAGGGSSAPNGVTATKATLSGPTAVAIDTSGNLYIADTFANLILQVSAAGSITTIAGGGATASGTDGIGDNGPATSAELDTPTGVALDTSGNVYISDTAHSMVRVVNVGSGIITAVAGTGSSGYSGDGELALNAELGQPAGLRLDANNNLYITDTSKQVVRFVNATSGVISTLAGNGSASYTGDGGTATAATFNSPSDIVLSTAGSVFVADYANNVIRQISFLPPTLTFPSTSVNFTSASVPVTISNYGNAALNLSNLAISSGFEQTSAATNCSASSSLASGFTCTIPLAFYPSVTGLITGTVTVASNDANQSSSQLTIHLTGTAISGFPAASASPSSLAFGNQAVGVASTGKTITLTNAGTAPLTISTVQIAGLNVADFLLTASTCQSTLAAGSSCAVTIEFSPRQSGSRTATVNFTDSAASSPQIVALSGTGTGGPIPTLSSSSIQFGSIPVLTSAAQTVTLTNTGVATLGIYGMALSGVNAAQFFLNSSTCESTLTAGASCTVSLGFDPTTAGVFSAQLLLTLSAGNSLLSVSLSGTGVTSSCISSVSPTSQSYPSSGASGSLAIIASSGCAWTANASATWIVITSPTGAGPTTLSFAVSPNTSAQPRTGTITIGNQAETIVQAAGLGLRFIPVTPCRIADTRNAGPFGPSIVGNTSRVFNIPAGPCQIPASAQAYALNVTVVPQGPLYYITVWPAGQSQPNVSTLNSDDGRVKANAVIVPAGSNGGVSVYVTNTTDIVLDINGYFVPESDTSALAFYTLTPCRLVDTRYSNGMLGEPSIATQETRNFPVLSSTCNVPHSAKAYSLNFTVVPKATGLGYLSTWPDDQAQPLVSTLNNPTKTVVANAAIVPAGGADGGISVYASNSTDLIIDIDGYFALPSGSAALCLYNVTPCRILDTRNNGGAPFDGTITPSLSACPVSGAQSLVVNATVVPEPALSYLSLWPAGTPQPQVSTLNANDGGITSNLAIVPVSSTGLSAYASGTTHLLLDLFAYFGP